MTLPDFSFKVGKKYYYVSSIGASIEAQELTLVFILKERGTRLLRLVMEDAEGHHLLLRSTDSYLAETLDEARKFIPEILADKLSSCQYHIGRSKDELQEMKKGLSEAEGDLEDLVEKYKGLLKMKEEFNGS